jgi:hypothetical protein
MTNRRLFIALLEPDHQVQPGIRISPEQEDFLSGEKAPFQRPVLPRTTRTPSPSSEEFSPTKNAVRFGVILESFDPRIITEVARDVLNLVGSLPPGSRLTLVSPTSGPLLEQLRENLPVDIQTGGWDLVGTWKTYWIHTKPKPPAGVIPQFEKFLGDSRKRATLRPGIIPSMPVNPDANRSLPAGLHPGNRSAPGRAPVSMTPQIYMWSSTQPRAGEKIVHPDNDQVLDIVKVHPDGFTAEVGADRVLVDMRGYKFFKPIDSWVQSS